MSQMTAAVLHGVGEELQLQEVAQPVAGRGEAVVQVRAAALNHRDVWIQKGKYAGLKFPIILGSDGAGTVASVGSSEDEQWVGQDVVICPSLAWGDNPRAQAADFRILGLPDDGTLAEYVKVPVPNLHAKPEQLSWEEASAVTLAALTAYRAVVTQGQLQAGQKVLVTGIGGGAAGFAMQFAAALGASVYVTSGDEKKLAEAHDLGAQGGVNYKTEDWARSLAEQAGGGFDLIIDSAGGDGFSSLIEIANPGGRIVFFGATLGNPPGLDLRRVFWKQLSLLGTSMGTIAEFQAMQSLYAAEDLHPVLDQVFPLMQVNDAFARMDAAAQFGKIVIALPIE
jgi:zinc-binding alcohol dehydrogenase/oxidoreductase